jgi:hypothetical protein
MRPLVSSLFIEVSWSQVLKYFSFIACKSVKLYLVLEHTLFTCVVNCDTHKLNV